MPRDVKRAKPVKPAKRPAAKPAKRPAAKPAASAKTTDTLSAIEDILRRAAGAGLGITELARIEKPGQLVVTDGLPGYVRGKSVKSKKPAGAVPLDLRTWPAFAVYRIDSGVVFAKFAKPTFPPLDQLVKPVRNIIFSRTLVELGTFEARSGVLALLPPKRTVDPAIAKRLGKAAMLPVQPGGSALVFCIMGAGDLHAAVALPGGVALAAAPSQYTVWEDSTPVEGPFGTIEKRVLVTSDHSVGHLDD